MACNPKDRHVLAGAVTGRAQVLVTFIVKPFPLASVDPHDLTVVTRTPFCSTSSTSTRGGSAGRWSDSGPLLDVRACGVSLANTTSGSPGREGPRMRSSRCRGRVTHV